MARFRCAACGQEGTFAYDGRHACPRCGSPDVQFALGIEEIPDDHPLIEAMRRLADEETGGQVAAIRFLCAACGQKSEPTYDPDSGMHRCPLCGSNDVVFAPPIHELPDEFTEALQRAEPFDNDENNED